MPNDVSNPMIFAFDLSDMPIIYFTLDSKVHGLAELRRIAEHELEPRAGTAGRTFPRLGFQKAGNGL